MKFDTESTLVRTIRDANPRLSPITKEGVSVILAEREPGIIHVFLEISTISSNENVEAAIQLARDWELAVREFQYAVLSISKVGNMIPYLAAITQRRKSSNRKVIEYQFSNRTLVDGVNRAVAYLVTKGQANNELGLTEFLQHVYELSLLQNNLEDASYMICSQILSGLDIEGSVIQPMEAARRILQSLKFRPGKIEQVLAYGFENLENGDPPFPKDYPFTLEKLRRLLS